MVSVQDAVAFVGILCICVLVLCLQALLWVVVYNASVAGYLNECYIRHQEGSTSIFDLQLDGRTFMQVIYLLVLLSVVLNLPRIAYGAVSLAHKYMLAKSSSNGSTNNGLTNGSPNGSAYVRHKIGKPPY